MLSQGLNMQPAWCLLFVPMEPMDPVCAHGACTYPMNRTQNITNIRLGGGEGCHGRRVEKVEYSWW